LGQDAQGAEVFEVFEVFGKDEHSGYVALSGDRMDCERSDMIMERQRDSAKQAAREGNAMDINQSDLRM